MLFATGSARADLYRDTLLVVEGFDERVVDECEDEKEVCWAERT